MLAEIHNKISQDGSNLSDRLEDKLTGDFFGTIRYLPFEKGMNSVLSSARFENPITNEEWIKFFEYEKGFMEDMQFWAPHSEGEIDLLIPFSELLLGIEVKYLSGISSDDQQSDRKVDYQESCHQLARYARMLKEKAGGRKPYLLFLAPYKTMLEVKKSLQNRPIIDPDVQLGFLSWEDILESLSKIDRFQYDTGSRLMLEDLIALLRKKGFMRYYGIPSDIIEKTISNEAYIFQAKTQKVEKWNWPSEMIRKGEHYVFRKN